jgi:Domain of unknown function (DUF4157)/Protein-glutamine gamma-glutamyltransferase
MLTTATADTKKANARGNAQPQAAPDVLLAAPPVAGLGNQATLRLMRKCDCGGGSDCDCDMGSDHKKKMSPRTALHRKASGSGVLPASTLLDAKTESFFEDRLQRKAASPAAAVGSRIEIGAVDDPLEAEADRTAERVMRMPDSAGSSAGGSGAPSPASIHSGGVSKVSDVSNGREAPRGVYEVLGQPGRPLESSTRAFFEPRFGQDLGHVRIHNDSKAAESARSIDALAFASGNNIVFGSGSYRPDRPEGRFILAHELAHTMQQGRQQSIRRIIRSGTGAPLDAYLKGKSIAGFTSSAGNYSIGRGTKAMFSEQEVLIDMLASARAFEIAGDTSADAEKSLSDHVAARLGIVNFAALKKYAFASVAGFKMNPKYWIVNPSNQSYKIKPGVDKQEAWDDLNVHPEEYAIGCYAAADITQAGGAKGANFIDKPTTDENDWVPGDAGYISNPNHPKNVGPGTLGENIIYAGLGKFWGHLPGDVMYRSMAEWKAEVTSWNGAAEVDSKRDGPVTGLL